MTNGIITFFPKNLIIFAYVTAIYPVRFFIFLAFDFYPVRLNSNQNNQPNCYRLANNMVIKFTASLLVD